MLWPRQGEDSFGKFRPGLVWIGATGKNSIGRFLLLGLLLTGLGGCAPSQPDLVEGDYLFIRNATIIADPDASPMPRASLLIRDDRIVRIGSEGSFPVPENARRYDAGGRFLLAGLWDMHTHVLWKPFVEDGYLNHFLVNGVTGIRDMGGTLEVLQSVRPSGRYHSPLHPRIIAAGPWLNQFVIDPRAGIAVADAEEARRRVAALATAGVDFIKVYSNLTQDQFRSILQEAARRGLPVAGHVPVEVSSREASNAGMRSIEHMQVETGGSCNDLSASECEALLATFRENQTWQTPTLLVRRNSSYLDTPEVAEDPNLRYAPPYLIEEWRAVRESRLTKDSFADLRDRYERERALVAALRQAGVPLLAGSDSGDIYCLAGFSIHQELALMVEAGLTTREALRAATLEPALYLGESDSSGTVAEGKLADLLLLDADPLENISNTRRIHAVVRNGHLYDRTDLDRILAEISAKAQPQ